MNPVRARLVAAPREFEWSSAEAHLSGQDRWGIADMQFWSQVGGAETWRVLFNQKKDEDQARALRCATYSGQPFGDEAFLDSIAIQKKSAASSAIVGGASRDKTSLVRAAYWTRIEMEKYRMPDADNIVLMHRRKIPLGQFRTSR